MPEFHSNRSKAPFISWTPPPGFRALTAADYPYVLKKGELAVSDRPFQYKWSTYSPFAWVPREYWGFTAGLIDAWTKTTTICSRELYPQIYVGVPRCKPIFRADNPDAVLIRRFPFVYPCGGIVFSKHGEQWYVGRDVYRADMNYAAGDQRSFYGAEKDSVLYSPLGMGASGPPPDLYFVPLKNPTEVKATYRVPSYHNVACSSPEMYYASDKIGNYSAPTYVHKTKSYDLAFGPSAYSGTVTIHKARDVSVDVVVTLKAPDASATKESAPGAEETTPGETIVPGKTAEIIVPPAEVTAPAAEEIIVPPAEDTASVTEESAPTAEESAPAAEESAPAAEETAPAAEESAPAAEESAPAPKKAAELTARQLVAVEELRAYVQRVLKSQD